MNRKLLIFGNGLDMEVVKTNQQRKHFLDSELRQNVHLCEWLILLNLPYGNKN